MDPASLRTVYEDLHRHPELSVSHACGHDMHVTWLMGAAAELAAAGDWHGTVVAVFQPAEELARGAQAMIDDGLPDRVPRPGIVLGQHVAPLPTGIIGLTPGPMWAASDSLRVTIYGRGGHGSRPRPRATRWSSPPRRSCACRRSFPARSRPPRRPCSPSARSRPAPSTTSSPTPPPCCSTSARTTPRCGPGCWPPSTASSRPRPQQPAPHATRRSSSRNPPRP